LIWTTDGQWVSRLTHPKRRVPRTYQAALARPFAALPAAGLELDDGHRPEVTQIEPIARDALHPALVVPADAEGQAAALFATITIVGGAYHEVRRIFAALGSHVLALARVAFGDFTLPPELPPGRYAAIDLPPLA